MRIIKNIISISLSASILSSSLTAFANGELCEKAFPAPSSTSVQLKKSLTVREHFKNLGMLKTDKELEQLKPADKMLYLSMMDLEYSKAQEILKLFATFPILTSPKMQELVSSLHIPFDEKKEKYLLSTRSLEREEMTTNLTAHIVNELGAKESELSFLFTEDLEALDSIEKERKLSAQKAAVKLYGIPDTMTKEIAQFFNQIGRGSNEFRVIQALMYRNFDEIVKTAMHPKSNISGLIAMGQVLGTGALWGATSFFSFGGVIDSALIGALIGLFAGIPVMVPEFEDKLSFSKWLENSKRKKREVLIRSELLQLAGLDPKSIQALPTVQQVKALPKSETKLADLLLPALLDKDVLAYPSVDLNRLENAIENRISLRDLENLQPSFDAIDEISENPFLILSFGTELSQSQYLIIGRETILGEEFKETAERMSVWQKKRDIAKTAKERTWIVEEKVKLLGMLNSQSIENASSWKYLAALEKAVQRFDTYLLEIISPKAGKAKAQVEIAHETLEIALDQIRFQIQSLQDRAKNLEILMTSLKRS